MFIEMSLPFVYPVDKGTADGALTKFSYFASKVELKPVFEEAVRILFGPHYCITVDYSKRMNFFCRICHKVFNCTKGLMAHHVCSSHIKNVDMQLRSSLACGPIPSSSRFPRSSLQHALACSQALILGAHLVEGYETYRRKRTETYFKCLLCGAHGNTEVILRHLQNDKHTDRYIKFNFHCDVTMFTPEIREPLRKDIVAREGIAIDQIKIIKDRNGDLYPFRWEDEGRPKGLRVKCFRHENIKKEENDSPTSSPSYDRSRKERDDFEERRKSGQNTELRPELSGSRHSGATESVKSTQQENLDLKFSQSPKGVVIKRGDDAAAVDHGTQVSTDWATDHCLSKLNFIVHTHPLAESEVKSQDDVKACLELMFSIGKLLQRCLNSSTDHCTDQQKLKSIASVLEHLNKMQHCVKSTFSKHWDVVNARGDCLAETLALWGETRDEKLEN